MDYFGHKKRFFLVPLIVLAVAATSGYAAEHIKGELKIPDSNHVQIITTVGGSSFVGRIVEIRDTEVVVESELGSQTIPISKIREVREILASKMRGGKYWFPNPNATRLFLGPTGRMLRKGQGYFSDVYLFFPSFGWGITDNISLGLGMSLFPGLGLDGQLIYLMPKVGVAASEKLHFAVGALLIKIPEGDDNDSPIVGNLYGVTTYGTGDASFTLGVGYGLKDKELADKPTVTVGGEVRLSRRIALVTENWLIPGADDPLISYGMRFFGESLAVDLALVSTVGEDAFFPGIPYVGFVFNF